MSHELLGDWKPSAEWYTPQDIWERVYKTFDSNEVYNPCPIEHSSDGFVCDWPNTANSPYIYVNPPTPAAPWAEKAIKTYEENKNLHIIFACFSEAVIWQVNNILDYPVCWVRNRINWIDGRKFIRVKSGDYISSGTDFQFEGKWYTPNPNYMKPSKSPRNYNAFSILSNSSRFKGAFAESFDNLGEVQLSRMMYKTTPTQ